MNKGVNKQILYMAVTPDKYELPLCVSDNLKELADRFNTTTDNISSAICHDASGKRRALSLLR